MQDNSSNGQTPRFFRVAQVIGILGVSLLLINFVYQMTRIHARSEQKENTSVCNLQTDNCTRHLQGDRAVTLSLTPRPIVPGTPLAVSVELKNMSADRVALFVFPYPATEPASKPLLLKKTGKASYTGQISIKKTATAEQKWIALVVLDNGTQQTSIPYRFTITQP